MNLVGDALNLRTYLNRLIVETMPFDVCVEMNKLNLRLTVNSEVTMEVDSALSQNIRRSQKEDEKLEFLSLNCL
jgi:hypothetical protein